MSEYQDRVRLLRMGFTLFLTYLSVALPLPVLSMHVSNTYGYANWLGGLAVGISFLSTIFSRKHAGQMCDLRGGKLSTIRGLKLYCCAAIVCLISVWLPAPYAYAVLILGRLILGLGESFTMVGIMSWNITLIGPQHSGKVIAITGMAMYGAFAAGGPLGLLIYHQTGLAGLMLVALMLTITGYLLLNTVPADIPKDSQRASIPFRKVIYQIWRLGAVVGLQGIGFAVLGAFISLYFISRGWPYAGLGLTCFGLGFVVVRIFLGGKPDKIGGIKIAMISLSVEALGQLLLWTAPNVWVALIGATLTGLGCSMIYPAMGVEVVKRIAPELRATALGAFAAFQDVAYAFSAPVAGLLADHFGYSVVYLLGSVGAVLGIILAFSARGTPA